MRVEFYKHNLNNEDFLRLKKVLGSVFLTLGEEVYTFESALSQYLGCKYGVGVSSCTAALHLSLLACGIGPGDEVITTPMTFIATPNAILHTGAKPVFVDVEPDTGNINADFIQKAINKKTKAIIPVHLYGQMCDMKKIHTIAKKNNLYVIEDCAHCLEGERDNIKPGRLSDAACFSFYATKNLTCGEGGAVITNNKTIADTIKRMRLHGMTKGAEERYKKTFYQHWDMDILGWKYNMFNIQAALLIPQLKRLDAYWQKRQEIYNLYYSKLAEIKEVHMPEIIGKSALHLFTIWVEPSIRDAVLYSLNKKGIGAAVNYRAIHTLQFYKKMYHYKSEDFPIACTIGNSTISLPFYPKLKNKEINYVIKSIKEIMEYY